MEILLNESIKKWLLEGDISIQYQVYRDLLNEDKKQLKERIAKEGWGKLFLSKRNANGHWGVSFYQPKWISSHYTLLDLKNLSIPIDIPEIKITIDLILKERKSEDGGVNPAKTIAQSDVCVNGMFLNYAAYFKTPESELESVVDFILSQQMPDGGFNCMLNRSGAVHSSLHSTISLCEGIREYHLNGYSYRLEELLHAEKNCVQFILLHRFFKSDHTGEVINKNFLKFFYPFRWKYDVLRSLDYFWYADIVWDERMLDAIIHLKSKRRKDGTWSVSKHPGQTHFDMEKAGQSSRWNTLRALRVLSKYQGFTKNYHNSL